MSTASPVTDVLLVPGLFSPRWMMRSLQRTLEKTGQRVETWDDARVFQPVQGSVDVLANRIDAICRRSGRLALVSHSFGDWLARHAVERRDGSGVSALVSLVPVLTDSLAARIAVRIGLGRIPEVRVMADRDRASAASRLPPSVARLVVWATIDPWVRRVSVPGATETTILGTHNSMVFQARTHTLVKDFLRGV